MKILCTSFVSKLFRSWCIRSFSEQFHIRHFSKAFYLHSKELVTFIRLSLSLPAFSDMCVRACVCYVPFGKVVWCFIFRLIFAIFVNLICSFLHHVATSSSIQQICSVYAMRCVVFQFYHQSWPTQFYVCVCACECVWLCNVLNEDLNIFHINSNVLWFYSSFVLECVSFFFSFHSFLLYSSKCWRV